MTAPSLWRRIRNSYGRSRGKRVATIDIVPDGFAFTWRGHETRLRWADITRIDAGVRDYLFFDGFYVVVFAGATQLEIDELDEGFQPLEYALFERWPQIRESWNRLLKTDPHVPQYETLWRRDEAA